MVCPKCDSKKVVMFEDGCNWICLNCKNTFNEEVSTKSVTPQKIFISYGHTEDEICTRICNFLRNRGHHIWFDKTHIQQGQNWRKEIIKGIETSNGVVACLSEHSMRNPGVCLDELRIAVGVKHGMIKTVLLEDERKVNPPSSINHIQWLDMHDWKKRLEDDPQKFKTWFNDKMLQLASSIENDEAVKFSGLIENIKSHLKINYISNRQQYLLNKEFIGRKWLAKKIEHWLDDVDGDKVCVLYGEPGIGKSTFAANYAHYNPRVAAGIFCSKNENNSWSIKSAIKTISYFLACRLPEYREVLNGVLLSIFDIDELNEAELFRILLSEPISNMIDGNHETICILIDGLDECGTYDNNELAVTINRFADQFPAWVKFLVTSRDVESVKQSLGNRCSILFESGDKNNISDIGEYFNYMLSDKFSGYPEYNESVKRLIERSQGVFLYANIVTHELLNYRLSITDTDSFPANLNQVFSFWFRNTFPEINKYKSDYRLPIGVIAYSPVPVPLESMKNFFGWSNESLKDFLGQLNCLLQKGVNPYGKKTVAFMHKYLIEWIENEDNYIYSCSKDSVYEFMYSKLISRLEKANEDLTEYEIALLLPLHLNLNYSNNRNLTEKDLYSEKMISDYSALTVKETDRILNYNSLTSRWIQKMSALKTHDIDLNIEGYGITAYDLLSFYVDEEKLTDEDYEILIEIYKKECDWLKKRIKLGRQQLSDRYKKETDEILKQEINSETIKKVLKYFDSINEFSDAISIEKYVNKDYIEWIKKVQSCSDFSEYHKKIGEIIEFCKKHDIAV